MSKLYIVTIKTRKNLDHDPRNKKTAKCVTSPLCTDVTGSHHCFLIHAKNKKAARDYGVEHFNHVTRVEEAVIHGYPTVNCGDPNEMMDALKPIIDMLNAMYEYYVKGAEKLAELFIDSYTRARELELEKRKY